MMSHNNHHSNEIPIVQGTAVDYHAAPGQDYYYQGGGHNNNNDNSSTSAWADEGKLYSTAELRQQRQDPPRQYKDFVWAVIFVSQLVLVIFMSLYLIGTQQQQGNYNNAQQQQSYGGVFGVVGVCGFLSIGLVMASFAFMMKNAEVLVQAALMFSVATSAFLGIIGLLTGNLLMGVLGCVSGVIGCCYAYFVWKRIPFAAANLKTALTAVRANMGLLVVALLVSAVAMGWSVLWFLGVGQALHSESLFVVFLLFLSYYWTHEVLRNTVHVTTAVSSYKYIPTAMACFQVSFVLFSSLQQGVVGTWWFVPAEADSNFSPALRDSWGRATTFSFGSICFGSFLVALVRSLRALERHARGNDDLSALRCIIQCILSCIESIIEYFNQWAYVYIGLYGMSYIEAGRNVLHLFEQKGWTVIITDDLADNVLFMMSVGIALFCGLVGWIWGTTDPNLLVGWDDSAGPAFMIAFIVGLLLSSIMLGVVNSAINTVIVCYADAPGEFQMNHPELSGEMRMAWTQAWPGLVN